MDIQFVNHASFVASTDHARIISDPWLEGRAFNDGWALLCESEFSYEDFREITHIWFSHEHPDHFHPPTLKKIPAEYRRNITVVFQKTIDQKVAQYVQHAGFAGVHELEPGRWERIAKDLEVYCCPWEGFEDSWICMRTPQCSLLNVNDCTVNTAAEAQSIRDQVGDVDVLFTQFGISAWDGNPEDLERRLAGAQTMVDRTVMHAQVFQPRFVVPFASFIWFCHEENFYMNEGLASIDKVAQAIESGSSAQPVILYPNDCWRVGEAHCSVDAIQRYCQEREAIDHRPVCKADCVCEDELMEASQKYREKLTEGVGRRRVMLSFAKKYFRRVRKSPNATLWTSIAALLRCATLRIPIPKIYVTDHEKSYVFDLKHGLRPSTLPEAACDVSMGSESLLYAFKFLWGGETLIINGRFRENRPDSRFTLTDYYHLAGNLNAGRHMSWSTMVQGLAARLPVVRRMAASYDRFPVSWMAVVLPKLRNLPHKSPP